MHISVHCPSCGSQYQVDPGLRGLRMRCPNPACRQVFQVWDEPEMAARLEGDEPIGLVPIEEDYPAGKRPPPPAEKPRRSGSGSVGEVVPILDAELAEEAAPPGSSAPASGPADGAEERRREARRQRRGRRDRRPDAEAAPPPRARPETAPPAEPGRPAAPLPSWHSPPPVRRPGASADEAPEPGAPAEAAA